MTATSWSASASIKLQKNNKYLQLLKFFHSSEGRVVLHLLLILFVSFFLSDVNECHDESLCTNGHCINTEGSFYCNCNHPWTPDYNKKKCVMATVAGE